MPVETARLFFGVTSAGKIADKLHGAVPQYQLDGTYMYYICTIYVLYMYYIVCIYDYINVYGK